MATSTLVPRPGIYGPTGSAPATFRLETGNQPAVNPAGPNAAATEERATWGVQHPWTWQEPDAFHKYQAQYSAIFSMPWISGNQPQIVKLLSLQQVNHLARKAWRAYDTDTLKPPKGTTPVDQQLKNLQDTYTKNGEDVYYQDEKWATGTAFLQHNKFSRFIWMSHVSFFHHARYAGPKITNPGEGLMPNTACTTVINGYATMLNYWGAVVPGQRLYFVLKKKPDAEYQMFPWIGWNPPTSADLEYVDRQGKVRFGFSYFVGIVNRRPQTLPDQATLQTVAGLSDIHPAEAHKKSLNYPTVDILTHVGDPRS